VPGRDGNFVDADNRRRGWSRRSELRRHVLLVQFLDGVPIETVLSGDERQRRPI
jgi:hypothetical protein